MGRLDGKVAIITGAGSGIGLGTVELFVAEGASVIAADIKDAGLGQQFQGRVQFQHCDVTRESDLAAAMQSAFDRFGGLDILFNNAGAGGTPSLLADITGEAWDMTQSLLLRSVALGMRYALPFMKARGGGAIVNTASIAGLQAGYGPIAYSVAKAGVLHLTRLAAAEFSRHNVRVNAICPGLILTNIFTAADDLSDAAKERVKAELARTAPAAQPVKKPGLPADIAQACLYLASDESGFVTGTHLVVDGGMTVGPRHSWDEAMQAQRAAAREALRKGD
jgi:NAD(P)-dependent dehydrogenase (short-subunit alcohol dehydrogenase family)